MHKLMICEKCLHVPYYYDAVYIRLFNKMYQIDVYSNAANIKWVFDWRSQASYVVHNNTPHQPSCYTESNC